MILSTSIVANGCLTGPLQLITLVGEHRVRPSAIGDQDTLEGVCLKQGRWFEIFKPVITLKNIDNHHATLLQALPLSWLYLIHA